MSILNGKAIAERLTEELAAQQLDLGLGIIVATDNPATATYVEQKHKAAKRVGFRVLITDLGPEATQQNILHAVEEYNRDPEIDGFIVQLPLPENVDADAVLAAVDPVKDADGLSAANLTKLYAGERPTVIPATPRGVLDLLKEAGAFAVAGKRITVVGQGRLTGKPLAAILEAKGAQVVRATRATKDLTTVTKTADVLIVAAGQPGLITAEMVKPGAIVIDVGVTKLETGTTGDVDFDAVSKVASQITPVPGGVGPMTVISLLRNVADLATSGHG